MGLLTLKEAAGLLAEGLGWPVRPGDVRDAIKQGRLRAETGPGRRDYLVPEEEVRRFIKEHGHDREAARARTEELKAAAWDALPRKSTDLFFQVRWRRRGGGRQQPSKESD